MSSSSNHKSIKASFLLMIGVGMLVISIVMTVIIGRNVFKMNTSQAEEIITALTEKKANNIEKEMMENVSKVNTLSGVQILDAIKRINASTTDVKDGSLKMLEGSKQG